MLTTLQSQPSDRYMQTDICLLSALKAASLLLIRRLTKPQYSLLSQDKNTQVALLAAIAPANE